MRIFTYEQAKERFGIRYMFFKGFIAETFNNSTNTSSSFEEEKKRLLILEKEKYQNRLTCIEEEINKKESTFISNLLTAIKGKGLIDKQEEYKEEAKKIYDEEVAKINELTLLNIPKNATVGIEFPKLAVGDKLYIISTKDNVLEIGCYETEVKSIDYLFVNELTSPIGKIQIEVFVNNERMILKANDDKIITDFIEHEVFTDYDDAHNYFDKMLKSKFEPIENE